MANPTGINTYGGPFEHEPQYGDIQRMKNNMRLAPIGSPQAVNAPRRAKNAAVKGKRAAPSPAAQQPTAAPAGQQQGPDTTPPSPAAPTYMQQVQAFWQQLAVTPGVSPLVQQYAQEAAGGTA